ncbi:MAG: hypothetical protein VX519_09595 [Myxococcota bacterium]|nr:hypothetical protein [Myxococcota bacterium]
MKLRHHWSPPVGTRSSLAQLEHEIVFPLVCDDKDRPGYQQGDSVITSLGLWCVNPVTGEDRTATAPFFIESVYGAAYKYRWRVLSAEDGRLVGVLMMKGSYDFRYYFFTYDGTSWGQVTPVEDGQPRPQQFIFSEQTTKAWEEPGEIRESTYMLFGGSLATAGEPLTFAADFTHAFSYDSGPMTPTALEYDQTMERAQHTSIPGIRGTRISMATQQDIVALLPADHRAHQEKWASVPCWFFEVPGGLLIADWDHDRSLHSVVCVDTSSS